MLGYGVRDGTPYLALEYVDGPSLRERLASHGPYGWPETKALLAQIAQGLADAHAAGVVHRDLKPSNILIGSDGVAKIADFGIAKGLDLTRVTGTSTLLGTPAYLPPEGPADERSDLYSLGVIAYELLTGVVPFEGRTYQEVILRHVRDAPDLERLPKDARKTIGWLLAKNPAKRPQTAWELVGCARRRAKGQRGQRRALDLLGADTGNARSDCHTAIASVSDSSSGECGHRCSRRARARVRSRRDRPCRPPARVICGAIESSGSRRRAGRDRIAASKRQRWYHRHSLGRAVAQCWF